MARDTVEAWLPEEKDTTVIQAIASTSVIESEATPKPMGSDTKSFPRAGGIGVGVVPKGSAYGEEEGSEDEVTLKARKFGTVVRLAEEDIDDLTINIVQLRKDEWAASYARAIDNATLAVTAAENGTTVPFTSVYRSLSQSDAATGYTANANIIRTAAGAAVTFDNLSALFALGEASDYFDPARALVIAHPSFKATLRNLKDGEGRLIFTPNPREADGLTLFGYPLRWSVGNRTSAVVTHKPTGNPLLTVVNRDFLFLGKRSGPESVVIPGNNGASALTDETLLKMRARRGFTLAHQDAAAILEVVPAV
jgi:HK97 family phage major capsid protein